MSAVRIEMFPAQQGDCLLLHYGPEREARMLVDVGPANAYDDIRARLDGSLGSDRCVDLLVITHVDTDHIEGALKLLRDEALGLTFGDIWFNSHEHLHSGHVDPARGGVQGEYLASLLQGRDWNTAVQGDSIRVWDGGEPMVIGGPEGSGETFTVLSPTAETAQRMAAKWRAACDAAAVPLGAVDKVLQRLEEDGRYDLDRGAGGVAVLGGDRTAPNGSSIAMLFETGGCRILLTGDAHSRVLEETLRRVAAARHESPLRLDAFKLSHHGSRGNITKALLELVDCDLFLVSTDGSHFGHPDDETIELIAELRPGARVCFNYRTERTARWASDTRIVAEYGEDGHAVVDIPST